MSDSYLPLHLKLLVAKENIYNKVLIFLLSQNMRVEAKAKKKQKKNKLKEGHNNAKWV